MMNAVGIDVSKRKSTVTIRRPGDEVILEPFDIPHTRSAIDKLIGLIRGLDGDTKVCLECTGRYYEPMASSLSEAGISVSAVNPLLISMFGDESLHAVKTDKADSAKIARFALARWSKLPQYGHMDETRNQLKTMNRQFGFYTNRRTAMKNNLIAILDQTYPRANNFFESPARDDGHQKWVDFVYTYWHVDRVRGMSLNAFTKDYQKWCKRAGYNFSPSKAAEIYDASADLIAVFPKDDTTKMLIRQAVIALNAVSAAVETLRSKMNETAATLPEYPVVMGMKGVGPSLGPQLMAEIGDVTRFEKRGSLIAFAGVDPGKDDSGDRNRKSVQTSKKGSPHLRKTLFQVMDCLIKISPAGDPVYDFIDKKRSEGKPYYVYMTAGMNKFLRIYYGRVKEYLAHLEEAEES